MKNSVLFLMTYFIALSASYRNSRTYSQKDIQRLSEFSVALQYHQNNIIDAEIGIKTGRLCLTNSDCPPTWSCQNLIRALYDLVNSTAHASEIPRLQRKAKIYGKECVRPVSEVIGLYSSDELIDRFHEIVREVNEILGDSERGVVKFGIDFNDLATMKFNVTNYDEPMQRVGTMTPYDPSSLLFLLFALRGKADTPSKDDTLLLILALSSIQNPGSSIDNNMFNNPFLLYTILGSDNSTTSSNVLLYSLLLSPNGGLGPNTMNPSFTFENPLILLSLLENNNNKMDLKELLPLLLLGGGGSGPGAMNSLLPLLLLSNSSNVDDKLLPLLLLSGGGLGGPSSGLMELLPILLSENNNKNNQLLDSLLPLLLLGGLGGSAPNDMQSLLPLLLLTNNSLGISNDNNFLTLLLLSGGANSGGLGALAPLLLLSEKSSGNDNDLLGLLLLLESGMGTSRFGEVRDATQAVNPQLANSNIHQILPLLLLLDSGSDNILLFLYIFGFITAVPDTYIYG